MNPRQQPTTEQIVAAEQVALLFQPFMLSLAATAVAAVLFVAAQWGAVAHDLVIIWATLLTAVTLLRVLLALMYRRIRPQPDEARLWAICSPSVPRWRAWPGVRAVSDVSCGQLRTPGYRRAGHSRHVFRGHHVALGDAPGRVPVPGPGDAPGHGAVPAPGARNLHHNRPDADPVVRLLPDQHPQYPSQHPAKHPSASGRRTKERSLALAKQEVEAASQAKSDFLANISHEFRTPMNIIIGMTHSVLQSRLEGHQQAAMVKVQRAAESLLEIINGILDFSRAQAVRSPSSPRLFRCISNSTGCIGLVSPGLAKGLTFTIDQADDLPDVLIGDAVKLSQVLQALVSNAIKFTERGEVGVRATLDSRKGPGPGIVQRDGYRPGIERSKWDSVFLPFSQGTPRGHGVMGHRYGSGGRLQTGRPDGWADVGGQPDGQRQHLLLHDHLC